MAGQSGLVTGAEVFFAVDGVKFASARSLTIREAVEEADYDPVGKAEVEEIIPLAYKVSGSMLSYRLINRSLKKLGLVAKTANPSNIFNHLTKTIEVIDVNSGKVLERLRGVLITDNERSYTKGSETFYSFNFRAVKVTDEAEN